MEKGLACSNCGTADWEWVDDPYAYHPIFHTCMGCQKKDLLNDDDTPRSKGTTVRLVPKETAERLAWQSQQNNGAGTAQRPRRRRGR